MPRQKNPPTVLIPVFYRAEMGGLQEHVRAQALGLRKRGFRPIVVCRSGLFVDSLDGDGITRIIVPYDDPEEDAERVLQKVRPAIVHTHPHMSRRVALIIAERTGCPLFVTYHGQNDDGLAEWGHATAGVVTVSQGIRDYIVSKVPEVAVKTVVLPNAVDLRRFRPPRRRPDQGDRVTVLVPSRFDEDKSIFVDLLKATWRHQAERSDSRISWKLAGDGTRIQDLREAASFLEIATSATVEFVGWQSANRLSRLYRTADACVAPGRSALEAMASGTPTFAAGSKGYTGPTWSGIQAGMYSNFGGISRCVR